MDSETAKLKEKIGEMQKRRVTMADERRYLIYYTFGGASATPEAAESLPETRVKPEMTEEKNV